MTAISILHWNMSSKNPTSTNFVYTKVLLAIDENQ